MARFIAPRLRAVIVGDPKKVCANEGCGSRLSRWRLGRALGLRANGKWYCSPPCFERSLTGELLAQRGADQPRGRMPLGMVMLGSGRISEEQLRHALLSHDASRERIGECMNRLGMASTAEVMQALAIQWQCPALHEAAELPAEAAMIPMSVLQECRMSPLLYARAARMLYLAFEGPVNDTAMLAVARMLDCRTEPCVCEKSVMDEMLRRTALQARSVEVTLGKATADVIARTATNYADELSRGEVRWTHCAQFFWMTIPREQQPVHLVFTGDPTSTPA